jgi:hypothetical protein
MTLSPFISNPIRISELKDVLESIKSELEEKVFEEKPDPSEEDSANRSLFLIVS